MIHKDCQVCFCNIPHEVLEEQQGYKPERKSQSRLNHNDLEMGMSSGPLHNTHYCALA